MNINFVSCFYLVCEKYANLIKLKKSSIYFPCSKTNVNKIVKVRKLLPIGSYLHSWLIPLIRASDRVRKKFGNYAALLGLIMRQERSIMRQIMRFHFS